MTYTLPTSVTVNGTEYEIRSDYRKVLEICAALADPELSDQEKGIAALVIFYPEFDEMPPESYQEAIGRLFWFLNCGDDSTPTQKSPKLMDWDQDFRYIVAPINRVLGEEIRSLEYLHWWTFVGAYYEIGDCLFAQIVRIRDQRAKGKTLDKTDAEWYRSNRELVDFKSDYTTSENDVLKQWGAG
jgi:hypothetical protein